MLGQWLNKLYAKYIFISHVIGIVIVSAIEIVIVIEIVIFLTQFLCQAICTQRIPKEPM